MGSGVLGVKNDGQRQAEEMCIPFRRFSKFGEETLSKVEYQTISKVS